MTLSDTDERGFGLKQTRFSQTAFSFVPYNRPENIPDPEEAISGRQRLHAHTEGALRPACKCLRLISAERVSVSRCPLRLMEDFPTRGCSYRQLLAACCAAQHIYWRYNYVVPSRDRLGNCRRPATRHSMAIRTPQTLLINNAIMNWN